MWLVSEISGIFAHELSRYDICGGDAQRLRTLKDYATYRKTAIASLSSVDSQISRPLDEGTTNSQDSYVDVTVHWINHAFQMKIAVFEFIHVPVSHTGKNLWLIWTYC